MRQLQESVPIPRWILVGKYVLFALLGFMVARSGSPSLEMVTSSTYLFWYGIALGLAAVAALVGAALRNAAEMVGALLLWCLLLVYVGATASAALGGHAGAQSISIIVLIVSMLPAARGFGLLIHRIRTRVKHVV